MRRLYRSREKRIIGGVAGGLAEYFEADVVLVRLVWVLTVLAGGAGLLAYIIAWIVIPEEKSGETVDIGVGDKANGSEPVMDAEQLEKEQQWRDQRRRHGGLLLIAIGLIFLAREVIPGHIFHHFWPLLLIVLGILLLARGRKEKGQ